MPYFGAGLQEFLAWQLLTQSVILVCCFAKKEKMVPAMAVFYIGSCLLLLWYNHAYLSNALFLILENAFSPKAFSSGVAGGGFMLAARYGIARGLFTNEAGLGSAAIAAASAHTTFPHRQALVSYRISLILFAFATLVGWSYFGKSAVEYLHPKGSGTGYIVVYLVMIFVGGIASLDFVWETADLLNAFMVIPNLIALFVLQRYLPKR